MSDWQTQAERDRYKAALEQIAKGRCHWGAVLPGSKGTGACKIAEAGDYCHPCLAREALEGGHV